MLLSTQAIQRSLFESSRVTTQSYPPLLTRGHAIYYSVKLSYIIKTGHLFTLYVIICEAV